MLEKLLLRSVFLGLVIIFSGIAAAAQSTIFNAPNTEIQSPRSLYVEADFISHFDKYSRGGFQTYGYRMVYGVTRKLEAGVNFFYTRDGVTSPKEIQLNAKYQLYSNEKHGVAIAVGGQTYTPLNRSSGHRTSGVVYSVVSKKLRRVRLTGGGYQMVHTERGSGSKRGYIVGVEVALVGNLAFTGDWFSGNNKLGYASAGLSITFGTRHFLQAGYSWGNNGRRNNAFQIFYGVTF